MRQPITAVYGSLLVVWILGGLTLVGAIVAFARWRRRVDGLDMGTVSGQWLVEYRQSQEL